METTKGGDITRTHAEDVLELPKILSSLSDHCCTEPGKQRARELCPLKTQAAVECELEKIQRIERSGETAEFFVPYEPGELGRRVQTKAFMSAEELFQIIRFISFVRSLVKQFKNSRLRDFFEALHACDDLQHELAARIDDTAAIRDDASPELVRIRARKKRVNRRLRDFLSGMLKDRPDFFTETMVVERAGHFVLPVKSNFKKQVKGIIHSFSNSGETVFIEPEAVAEDAALLIELDEEERIEIETILRYLTDMVRDNLNFLESDIERVVGLDLLFAKVGFARELHANRPVFDRRLRMINAFHPILKRISSDVVPLSLDLNSGKSVLLISGPNAGGKTIVLKTVGLAALMAKCGLFVPADEGSSLPFFDQVYADIGDEQSIESQLSTFAAHLKQVKTALEGDGNSLVLLDELMSQTSVEEGSALASAILDEMSRNNNLVLATTHNENLKIFVSNRSDMLNAGMEYTDKPTYRLILGVPQPSNALRLARTLGIKEAVLDKASSFLDEKKVSLNELFEELSREYKRVEKERERLSAMIRSYEDKLAAFNLKKKQESDEMRLKYRNELKKAKGDIERLIKTLRKEGPKPDLVRQTRDFFKDKDHAEPRAEPYHPSIGELVRIRELRRIGQVVAEKGGKYKIGLENIYYWVEPTDIQSLRDQEAVQS
jgi:DNA mismatch repair protein MutS2